MKKIILDLDFDFSFKVWGIISPLRDFQVALFLNKALKISLKCDQFKEVSSPDRLSVFSVFKFEDEINKCTYHLISNRYSNDYLLPELRGVDYLLRFNGCPPDHFLSDLVTKVKGIDRFTSVLPIEPQKLKSGTHLLVD